MANDQTDLFEADGVTPKADDKKVVITPEVLEAREAAARAEGKAAGLETALKAAPKAPAKPATTEKVFTRAELRAQVNEGKITEDQMDDILDRQLEAKFDRKVDEKVETRLATKTTADKASAEIDRYLESFPDINKDGTALRAKLQEEFDTLVAAGSSAASIATELAAIKIACGPLRQGNGRKPGPDAHQETGGAGTDGGKPDTAGWAKGLTPRMKDHYTKMVNNGVYKGYADPNLVKEVAMATARRN